MWLQWSLSSCANELEALLILMFRLLLGQVIMSKYAIPAMAKNEGLQWRGSIVNLSSVAGIRGGTPHLLYPTSKGAIVVRDRREWCCVELD